MSKFHEDMLQFCGSECLYFKPMSRDPKYTEGVRYFFQNAGNGAYWLYAIWIAEPAIRKQAREFASITLTVKEQKAHLSVNDGNDNKPVFEQLIPYTDCPEGIWKFYWIGDVIMLSSEY